MNEKISDDPVFFNRLFFLCFAFSAFAIFFSFFQEYVLKNPLCRLCLLQRLPYFSVIFFSALGFFKEKKAIPLNLVMVCLLASFVLGFHHTLVQYGVLSDPCHVPKINSIENFSTMIFDQIVPCSKIQAAIFGLPISLYNATLSLLFFVWVFREKKNISFLKNTNNRSSIF